MLNVSNEFSKNSEIRDTCREHSKNKEINKEKIKEISTGKCLRNTINACKWKCRLRLQQLGSAQESLDSYSITWTRCYEIKIAICCSRPGSLNTE